MMNRIVWIDIAKALCIILVAIGHYIPDTHPMWYREMRNIIYSFHMPLFMFASGFVYIATKREIGYGDHLWRKVQRLMIPYLTVSVLIITIKLCTQGHADVENPVTLLSYLKIFYLPEAGYFLWFIWALWWMFVIIPFFKTPLLRVGLFAAALIFPIATSYLPDEFCLKQFSNMLRYFMAGVIVYDWKQHFMWCRRVPLIVVCLVFCMIEALPCIGVTGMSMLTACIGIALVLRISYMMENHVRTSTWGIGIMTISHSSYIIYLLHTTFEGFIKALVLRLPYLSNLSNDVMFCIAAVMVISFGVIGPVLLYKYVLGKYKVTRFLFGLK